MVLKMLKIETCFYIFFDILTQRYWWVWVCVCVCVCVFCASCRGNFWGAGGGCQHPFVSSNLYKHTFVCDCCNFFVFVNALTPIWKCLKNNNKIQKKKKKRSDYYSVTDKFKFKNTTVRTGN